MIERNQTTLGDLFGDPEVLSLVIVLGLLLLTAYSSAMVMLIASMAFTVILFIRFVTIRKYWKAGLSALAFLATLFLTGRVIY